MDKEKSLVRKFSENLGIIEVKKPGYQVYDSITYDEVDDVANHQLTKIPEKVLYQTNRKTRDPNKFMFFHRQKDFQSADTKEIFWSKRTPKEEPKDYVPNLGNIDPVGKLQEIKTVVVNDKGVLIACNDPYTAHEEITQWERAMDIAIGMHFSEWSGDQKLAYMEKTMTGNAALIWQGIRDNPTRYEELKTAFATFGARGDIVGGYLKKQFCGITDDAEEKARVKEKARQMLSQMKLCQVSMHHPYTTTFVRLYAINGDTENKDLLRMYFEKFPTPVNQDLISKYGNPPDDSLGKRIQFFRKYHEDWCLSFRIKEKVKNDAKRFCTNIREPTLEFGCSSQGTKSVSSYKKKRRSKYPSTRRFSKKRFSRIKRSKRPRFIRKRSKTKPRHISKVKCFGCNQLGHYANKCTNKKSTDKINYIEECGLICIDEIESDWDQESYYELSSASDSSYESDNNELQLEF